MEFIQGDARTLDCSSYEDFRSKLFLGAPEWQGDLSYEVHAAETTLFSSPEVGSYISL